jgi:hypothetical protein
LVGVGVIGEVAAAAGMGLRRLRQLRRRGRTFAELNPAA